MTKENKEQLNIPKPGEYEEGSGQKTSVTNMERDR